MGSMFWSIALLAVAIYCAARGIVDLRQKRYVWGAVGMAGAIILLTAPIKTQAVSIDLPISQAR